MSLSGIILGLAGAYLIVRLIEFVRHRRRLIKLIDQLPGPPNIPIAPLINHALVIVYLDSLRHQLGSYFLTYHVLSNLGRLFPDTGICRLWLGLKPIVVLYSPENVESILNSTSVINKSDEYRFFEPWIGEGLVTSKSNKWRFRRKILTPAFHFRILNDFLPIINQEANKLVQKLARPKYLNSKTSFDITPVVALCTLDTICETAMGVQLNCQDDERSSVYVSALKEVGEIALSRVTRPWLWPELLFGLTDSGKRFRRATAAMHQFTTQVILDRRADWSRQLEMLGNNGTSFDDLRASSFFSNGDRRLAFLDLMLHQHLVENTMSIDDIREEVDTFMFAGHDTTAMCISWALYMLGLHHEIQEKAQREIDQLMNDQEDLNPEQLRQMKYLDRIIKETLRMWPSIPFVARQMTEDVLVNGKYLIPEGATCMVFTQALHNNPRYYPKPEIFEPDRFLPENVAERHPYAYIPFSAGPRNCIGQRFAQMEVKIILAKVLKNYTIKTVDHRDKLAVVGELVLRSRNGLNVTIEPRSTC